MPNTIEWSEKEIQNLIEERRSRNDEYHRIFGRSRVGFWSTVAENINDKLETKLTGAQCSQKFKNLIQDCKVSKY
jgi:hypothetical protein